MTRCLQLIVVALLAGCASGRRPSAGERVTVKSGESTIDPLRQQRIDSLFAGFGTTTPGCAIGVMQSGRLGYARGYGTADLQHGVPITPASVFHVASISKQFTAFVIALLAREGKLRLDDDIRSYVPSVPDFGPTITLRHLLQHTSGLRDQWTLLSMAGWRADDVKSEADILELVARQQRLNFEPGEFSIYSNTGYTLLAVLVRTVTGMTLADFAEARIFKPLGMAQTHFHADHRMIVPGRTSAYEVSADGRPVIALPVFDNVGATGLMTTVDDLARWEANWTSAVVGDTSIFSVMETPLRLNDGRQIGYGLGLFIGSHRDSRTVGHGGSDAGYVADFVRFPDHRLAVSVLCNRDDVNPGALSRSIADILLPAGAVTETSSVRAGTEEPPDSDAAALAGRYFDSVTASMREYRVRNGRLYAGSSPLRRLSPMVYSIDDDEVTLMFVPAGPSQPRTVDELATGARSPRRFVQVEPPSMTSAMRHEYVGAYYSEELDSWRSIVLLGDSLIYRQRKFADRHLTPVGLDLFVAGPLTIQVDRGAGGRVTALSVSTRRAWNMVFVRRPPPSAPSP